LIVTGFGPVLAALGQRVAPALSLPRRIRCGTRGMSRILGEEIERQIAPRDGLLPSPYFPPTLFGSISIELANMGFSVLQHVYGDPDPVTMVRPMFTRRFPTWAVNYYEYRKTFVAQTTEGPVDIINGDGKFTIIGDSEQPHHFGAIIPIGEEALDGKTTQRARASYIDRFGNPKWIATLPPGISVASDEGKEYYAALKTIRGPDGFGALPNGSKFEIAGLVASQSDTFGSALASNWQYIAAVYLGSDGTMSKDAGPYSAPIFKGVRRDHVDRDLSATVRGINCGHIAPWLHFNHAQTIAEATGWIDPVLDIPLPDPDSDARIKSYGDRMQSFLKVIDEERKAGFDVTQERVNQLARAFEVDPPSLAVKVTDTKPIELAPTDLAKVFRVDEVRNNRGFEPLGDDRGDKLLGEMQFNTEPSEDSDDYGEGPEPPTPVPDPDRPNPEPADGIADSMSIVSLVADWDEAKHPRKGGKFAKKGEGDSGAKSKPAAKRKTAKRVAKKTPQQKEKEKERAKKAKEKERAQKAKEKERAQKAKEKERAQKAKERERAKKAKEKERAQKAKERDREKARKKKERADAQERARKAAVLARERAKKQTKTKVVATKKEHTPEHWEQHYAHLGAAATQAAWGRAAHERGLELHPDEASKIVADMGHNGRMLAFDILEIQQKHPKLDTLRKIVNSKKVNESLKRSASLAAVLSGHKNSISTHPVLPANPDMSSGSDPERAKLDLSRAKEFFSSFVDEKIETGTPDVRWGENGKNVDRGYYNGLANRIYVSPSSSVLQHEYGHAIEEMHPGALTASLAFLDARTKGEPDQKIRDILNESYDETEVCKPDKFIHPYSGKRYGNAATEILSMGMQHIQDEPHRFFLHDPDYFYFTLGQLAGHAHNPSVTPAERRENRRAKARSR